MNPCFFIFGFGYTAAALAPQLIQHGFEVIATSRTPNTLKNELANIKLIDFNSTQVEQKLKLATHILICIPPSRELGDVVLMQYGELIKKQASHLKWLGYLSSTGVYGDHQGNWVDEESPCVPHTPTGITRLEAEQSWFYLAEKNQLPLHVFRLSGIYGPKRNVLERIRQGKKYSIFKENQVFCRIHVEDIVSTLIASITSPNPLSIYNVSDDEPAPPDVVDKFAAHLLHQVPPVLIPFTEANMSPMEKDFYTSNRRVSNFKIKQSLKICLKYPSYKEGLTEIWRNDFEHE